MPGQVLEIRIGEKLWLDGQSWLIAAVGPTSVRLTSAGGTHRTAAIEELMQSATALGGPIDGDADVKALGCQGPVRTAQWRT